MPIQCSFCDKVLTRSEIKSCSSCKWVSHWQDSRRVLLVDHFSTPRAVIYCVSGRPLTFSRTPTNSPFTSLKSVKRGAGKRTTRTPAPRSPTPRTLPTNSPIGSPCGHLPSCMPQRGLWISKTIRGTIWGTRTWSIGFDRHYGILTPIHFSSLMLFVEKTDSNDPAHRYRVRSQFRPCWSHANWGPP